MRNAAILHIDHQRFDLAARPQLRILDTVAVDMGG
jgi:hypothetical protein